VHIAYTAEQADLLERVRALLAEIMTPELRAECADREGGGPIYHQAMQRLGREGWLGLGWPKEAGGGGRSLVDEFIFFDEMHRQGFPIPLLTLNTVGPTLAQFGTPEQKAKYLPQILAGKLHFSIGYSEPSAGTDLASLTTRAERVGDEYVITGQKIWISLADHADFLWLACRTDPTAPKHRGISIIMVPMNAPGVSFTPIKNLGDANIAAVYLEGVRVPVGNLIGKENAGWRLITSQLNHERVALMMVGPLARLSKEVLEWAAQTDASDDKKVLDLAWVRRNLARVEQGLEVLRLMNWRQAANLDHGTLLAHEASAIKVYGSEFYVEAHRLLIEVLGAPGILSRGSSGALLRGELERHYRATLVLTFGGGVNEVQRDIIATVGLGLPRAER
jgi:alkylation response protein AidB-like acyl-CoA dehydrogenase